MQWLNKIADEAEKRHPKGEITVSSGVSPSGTYHLGTMREVLTAEAVARELKRRGRQVQHLHIVDDLDVFRKVPADVPSDYEKYLGRPLCDIPAPDGSDGTYADYFFGDLEQAAVELKLEMKAVRSHKKYREGFFAEAIEKTLEHIDDVRKALESISGRELDERWTPIQVNDNGYLKNRHFESIDTNTKMITYTDQHGTKQEASYAKGDVKLNWRVDWPARWWLMGVDVEPFGRDHATKGGSYDTGTAIVKNVFDAEPPLPVPYAFINRTGDTKKMSKSNGDVITIAELLQLLPPEVIWFFIIRYAPDKQLFFDQGDTLVRLVDEFAELLAKPDKTDDEKQLLELCLQGIDEPTISNVPFSHLVASYQAALKDADKTLEIIKRTEHALAAGQQEEIIKKELQFIDNWLEQFAPEDVKFELSQSVDASKFNETQQKFMKELASKIEQAPESADGEWFHKTVYDLKDSSGLEPKELFQTLYQTIIGKDAGPRAGWFLSMLPRDWLVQRLKLEA